MSNSPTGWCSTSTPTSASTSSKVKKAAVELKALLADLGLKTFPLLSGGKGVHVVVPLTPRRTGRRSRFRRALQPRHRRSRAGMFTANIRKAERKGRIFLDWLRNQRGATAVMPYSARAREGAPVVGADRLGRARQV